MTTTPTAADDGRRVYTADITRDNRNTDRCLRKWIATGRFPPPDGNLNGRNFWLSSTYERWKRDVLAGKYRRERRPPGQRRAHDVNGHEPRPAHQPATPSKPAA